MAESPAFLRGGFRPFFLVSAAWALVALVLWLCSLAGAITLPVPDALAWHRHEMLFGFVVAAVAGFMLTAIPNWTGRLPIAGSPLAGLVLLWLAGRAAMLGSGVIGPAAAAAVDVSFPLVLGLIALQEVLAAKNRNVPVAAAMLLLAVASGLDHAGMAGLVADPLLGVRLGIGLITLLISLIGGRIIPSFTRNWLAKRGETKDLPTQPGPFDLVTIGATAIAFLFWAAAPEFKLTGLLLLFAAALQLLRLLRWQGSRTAADRLVLILHVAFLWVPVGLALLGASILTDQLPRSVAIHALMVGAAASMILAVMTRASLGHTGRALKANGPTQLLFGLITAAAVTRVAAPLLSEHYTELIRASALLFIAAFALFLLAYLPVLASPRKGEK
ncbi:NnrS family protein [Sphingomonas sp. KRR8]|uniref:NnrS family protein n=1 Tax=Sphingomonas sp. KRR8 TaxID=2942996 RepID=UPI0020214E29|nr:NnrS family protein [Sphingomonas sp. KRR8]URD59789.1 NnrS family protein [Sphingomonas sp. KRR8]